MVGGRQATEKRNDRLVMRCYRYMKFEHAVQSLQDNFFKVNRLSQFNDPFECRARFINSCDVPALRKFVHMNFARLKSEAIRQTNSYTPDAQQRFTENLIFERYLDSVKKHSPPVSEFDNIILVMCLVNEKGLRSNSDILFWSHYADSGKGIRITFDLEMTPAASVYYMKKVRYSDFIPTFDMSLFEEWLQGDDFKNFISDTVTTKGSAWNYENEVRMIIPLNLPVSFQYITSREVNGAVLQFVKIGYDAIRRVDFGPRCNSAEANSLINDLKSNTDTKHIHFFKTTFHPEKYAYCYERVA